MYMAHIDLCIDVYTMKGLCRVAWGRKVKEFPLSGGVSAFFCSFFQEKAPYRLSSMTSVYDPCSLLAYVV